MSAMQQIKVVRQPQSEFPRVRAYNETVADGTRTVGVQLWRTHVSVAWRAAAGVPTPTQEQRP